MSGFVATHPEAEPHQNRRRSRLWRERGAWEEPEVRPCGTRGALAPRSWHCAWRAGAPDLSDCLVARPSPFRLVIWESIATKAPGPHLAQPYCCYVRTIIFYCRPYALSPWTKIFRTHHGWHHNGSPGHFEEWDEVKSRLGFDDVVEFEGELFDVHGGTVIWANVPGERRRWWMRHAARRRRSEASA